MKTIELIMVVIMFGLIVLGIYALVVIKNQGTECLVNPLQFAIENVEPEINSCSCGFKDTKYTTVIVNEDGINPVNTGGSFREVPNWTGLLTNE